MTPAETTLRTVLWWAVLVSCHAFQFHAHAGGAAAAAAAEAQDHQPYKRLAVKNNTTEVIESTSLPHSSSASPSTSTFTSTAISISKSISASASTFTGSISRTSPGQDVSTADIASEKTSSTIISGDSYSRVGQDDSITTSTAGTSNGEFSAAANAHNSDARVLGGTFIANITTLSRPPLTAPTTSLANQPVSTKLPFPIFSLNTTNNATTTTSKSRYTNSSITITAPPTTTTTEPPTTTDDFCTTNPYDLFSTVIEYSIIHTWTITWYGDPADYTPPFPTISIPKPCTPTTTSATGRFTISVCDSSGQSCSLVHGDDPTTPTPTSTGPWWVWLTDSSAVRGMEPTLTFVTTDKNPAVVFPTSSPPDYGGSPDAVGNVHSAAYPNEAQSSPDAPGYGNGGSGGGGGDDGVTTNQNIRSMPITSPEPVTVIVKPSMVIIDDQTFTNNPAQPTSTVVVDGNSFTINPTQVIGVGATVTRPPNTTPGASPPPMKTTVGDIGVDIEASSVIIDKTTFTIGPKPTTVVVKGQSITLGPSAIAFPSQTFAIPGARDTTQVVFGAELITAIGSDTVIIEGRTITYGPPSSLTITSVIDGDTILIGPSGIIAHGETYGGLNAAATATQFAVVGGVTISQVGPTALVIHGITYTLEPIASRQSRTTTVLGGETITIGPDGVSVGTWTLDQPYASTTTITPSNGAARALPTATATATAASPNNNNNNNNNNSNKPNSGPSLASRRPRWALTACVAAGAGVLGARLL